MMFSVFSMLGSVSDLDDLYLANVLAIVMVGLGQWIDPKLSSLTDADSKLLS